MAGMGDHDLRTGRVDFAGVDVAHAARLSQHVFETWHRGDARGRGGADSSDAANAGHHKIHRRQRSCFRRTGVSLRLHHHRLRRGFRISLAHCFGHDAENDQARVANPQHRLRRDGDRDDGRVDGDDRRVRAATGRIFRDQHERNADRSCRKGFGGRFSGDRTGNADACHDLGESTMFNRAGGAPTFAVGMAHMFARVSANPTALALWYHFAIMFEALFILTTIDAGTRVGRFLLQDFLGNVWRPLGNTRSWSANFLSSCVAGRGMGLVFVSGRHRSAWRHQLALAAVWPCESVAVGDRALSWHDASDQDAQSEIYFVTLVPLCFMCAVTFSAGYLKVFSSDPRLGFLSGARSLLDQASTMADPAKAAELVRQAGVWRFDAVVAVFFLVLVLAIVVGSARQWWQLIRGTKRIVLHESEFVPITPAQLAQF